MAWRSLYRATTEQPTFTYIYEPLLKKISTIAFSDVIARLPIASVPGFQNELRDLIVYYLGTSINPAKLSAGALIPLNIAMSELASRYIEVEADKIADEWGPVAGGSYRYVMQVLVNSAIAYFNAAIYTKGQVVKVGAIGVGAAVGVGVI